MRIPLFNKLKKRIHKEIGLLQDEVVDIIYDVSPNAVLHGGTAIWRCYNGNRFSEDLDFYLLPEKNFKGLLKERIEARNLVLTKFKKTKKVIFSKISSNGIDVRLEASLRKPKRFEPKAFEKIDNSFFDVFTLSAEDLIIEKMNAFLNRKLIRDFYDVYFLSSIAEYKALPKEKITEFLEKSEKPLDEKNLKTLIFSGAVPSFDQMLESLKRRFK